MLVYLVLAFLACFVQANADGKKPCHQCTPEKSVEAVRKLVKQWPDYVNTGNIDFLLKNWVQKGATIETIGDPFNDRCDRRLESVLDYLYYRDNERILSDLVNIKTIQYQRDGSVVAVFVLAAGIKGHNLALYNENWVFVPREGCDFRLAKAQETKVECLSQDPTGC